MAEYHEAVRAVLQFVSRDDCPPLPSRRHLIMGVAAALPMLHRLSERQIAAFDELVTRERIPVDAAQCYQAFWPLTRNGPALQVRAVLLRLLGRAGYPFTREELAGEMEVRIAYPRHWHDTVEVAGLK